MCREYDKLFSGKYTALVNREKESWDEAVALAFQKLRTGQYAAFGAAKKAEFLKNLGGCSRPPTQKHPAAFGEVLFKVFDYLFSLSPTAPPG